MALLYHLGFDQTEPEYFTYVWKKLQNKQSLKESEFIELLDKPKRIDTEDPEEMKNVYFAVWLIQIFAFFDEGKKGSFSIEEFKQYLKFSPTYMNNPQETEENLEKCFKYMKSIYGNNEITPREFYDIMKHNANLAQ